MIKKGKIEVIYGPMFSGKTEELIKRATKEINKNKKVSLFKPFIDNRYSNNHIVSHNNKKIKCNSISSSKRILNYIDDPDVFAIDEAQFFDKEIIQVCRSILNKGKKIILAGLDKDSYAKPFGKMDELIALSDETIKLTSVCFVCSKPATLTYRKSNEKKQVLVGESDKYEARCKKCYYNQTGINKWKDL